MPCTKHCLLDDISCVTLHKIYARPQFYLHFLYAKQVKIVLVCCFMSQVNSYGHGGTVHFDSNDIRQINSYYG